jgi:hypothetical protein
MDIWTEGRLQMSLSLQFYPPEWLKDIKYNTISTMAAESHSSTPLFTNLVNDQHT